MGVLRLSSEQFWALTLKELEAAMSFLSDADASRSLTRSSMNELLQQFPDEVKNG